VQLREWQDRFQRGVVQPEQSDDRLFPMLLPGSTSKQAQLDIYVNAYVLRLIEALLSNYPALHQLLGDLDFGELGKAYLRQHPPRHASIRWFGDALAEFLARQTPYAAVPVLSELARFEWALRHTIDAADCEPVTAQALQAVAPECWGALLFATHSSVTVLHLHWNTLQIWQALTDKLAPPAPEQIAMGCIVYRQADLVSSWRSATSLELAALECLVAGGSFADICEVVARLTPAPEDSSAISAGLLRLWVEQRLIAFRNVPPRTGE
jgi:hypothetical protein